MRPRLRQTPVPRWTSSFPHPPKQKPRVCLPHRPSSKSFRNISTPVTTVLRFRAHPHDASASSPRLRITPTLDPSRRHRPPSRDREHILHRHQKRLVHVPLRLRDVAVDRLHQLVRCTPSASSLASASSSASQRRAPSPPARSSPGKPYSFNKLPHLQLHELQQVPRRRPCPPCS